jgi:hypothetical protein
MERNVVVDRKVIKSARKIFVDVIFNKDETGWVEVSKKAILETLSFGVKRMVGDFDRIGNLWISREY